MAIIDFWNTGLNPITLYPRYTEVVPKTIYEKKKTFVIYMQEDLSTNPDYILSKEAQKILGIASQKIREAVTNNGIVFNAFKSRTLLYYRRKDIEGIEIVIPSSLIIPDEYISGVELRELNGWTSWDLWSNASKNGWAKKKFKGNIAYYLKSEVLK